MTTLSGKRIFITGATGYLGQVAAKAYADQGAELILHGRDLAKLETLYQELTDKTQVTLYPMDFIKAGSEDFSKLAEVLDADGITLDGLLLNASADNDHTPIQHHDIKNWYEVFQTNVHANFMLIKALLPSLLQSQDARLIFTLANPNTHKRAYWGAYGVTQSALDGLFQIISAEFQSSTLKVNAFLPATSGTPFMIRNYPGGNPGLPSYSDEQLAEHYLYLMSPESQNLHGQITTPSIVDKTTTVS